MNRYHSNRLALKTYASRACKTKDIYWANEASILALFDRMATARAAAEACWVTNTRDADRPCTLMV